MPVGVYYMSQSIGFLLLNILQFDYIGLPTTPFYQIKATSLRAKTRPLTDRMFLWFPSLHISKPTYQTMLREIIQLYFINFCTGMTTTLGAPVTSGTNYRVSRGHRFLIPYDCVYRQNSTYKIIEYNQNRHRVQYWISSGFKPNGIWIYSGTVRWTG